MNQRMLELVEESRDRVPTQTKVAGHVYVPGPMVRGDVNLQRFAELIVAECVSIAQSADDNSWKLDGKGTEIARNIQQHFGVEE